MLALSLSSCSLASLAAKVAENSSGKNDPIQPAEIHNRALADETAALLASISDSDWEPAPGGNILSRCEARGIYSFYGSWYSPELAAVPGDAEAAGAAIAQLRNWLEARGWIDLEDIEFTTDSVGVNALGIAAWNERAGVYDMQAIFYYEGDIGVEYPHIVVDIDSDCLPADIDPANPDSGGPFIPAVNTA